MSQLSISGRAIGGQRAAIPSEPSKRQGDLSHTRYPRVTETLFPLRSGPQQQRKEGDLLLGRGLTQMATVIERASRFTVLVQLDGRDMTTVAHALAAKMNTLPIELRRSLTWDRGMELASHTNVTEWTGLDVYFADPRSPWQRGTNENTNGLLRQYFPKGVTMAGLTQSDLDVVALKLNTRPRKTLGYRTPATILEQMLL